MVHAGLQYRSLQYFIFMFTIIDWIILFYSTKIFIDEHIYVGLNYDLSLIIRLHDDVRSFVIRVFALTKNDKITIITMIMIFP